jgi:hypothetical protein
METDNRIPAPDVDEAHLRNEYWNAPAPVRIEQRRNDRILRALN